MVPPLNEGPTYGFDEHAPLNTWNAESEDGYDNRDQCETAQRKILEDWTKQAAASAEQHGGSFDIQLARLRQGRCVALDDPALRRPGQGG